MGQVFLDHSAASDNRLQEVLEHPQKEVLALLEVAEGGAAGGLGGGAGGAFGFGQEVHRDACAGGDHFLDGQAVGVGFDGVKFGGKDLPGFAFVGNENASRAGGVGVELGLTRQAFGFGLEAGLDDV